MISYDDLLNQNKSKTQHESNGEYLADEGQSALAIAPPSFMDSIQLKEENDSGFKDHVATGAGGFNTAGNIIGGIMEKVMGEVERSFDIVADLQKEADLAQKAANAKAHQAKIAAQNAGSGKSASKSAKASKAAKQANAAKKAAAMKTAKAAKAAREANKLLKLAPKIGQLLRKVPLEKLGFAASFIAKALTSHNQSLTGKAIDATATAGLDVAFGSAHPIVAAIDAVVGLIPGGERFNISNTMSDSVSSITTVGEGILTGDTRGMQSFYDASMKGETTWYYQKAAEIGTEYGKYSEDRVQTVGDFYGGADTKTGRAAAFISAVPGIGDIGEGIGYGAFKTVKGVESLEESLNESGRTLDPRKVDWSNPLGLW